MCRTLLRPLFPALILLLSPSLLRAAWEDAAPPTTGGGPATRQPTPYAPRPPAPVYAAETLPSAQGGSIPYDLYSQFLDTPVTPAYRLSLLYVGESEIEGYGATSMVEAEADWELLYFPWVLGGSIDMAFRFRTTAFLNDPGIALPDVAGILALDGGWTWRFDNGYALELRAMPGIYSDLTGVSAEMFSYPFQGVLMRTLSPNASALIGVEVRPGWDLLVMPLAGIAWEAMNLLRVEAMIPRTRVLAYTGSWLTLFGVAEWRNITYNLEQEEGTPDAFTLNDIMLSAGLTVHVSDQLHLGAEYGFFASRTLSADVAVDDDLDISGEPFFRFTLSGPF